MRYWVLLFCVEVTAIAVIACDSGQSAPVATLTNNDKCATAETRNKTATPDIASDSTAAAQGTPYELILCPGTPFDITFTPECMETLRAYFAAITRHPSTVEVHQSPDCY